jgi:hypothetical protein
MQGNVQSSYKGQQDLFQYYGDVLGYNVDNLPQSYIQYYKQYCSNLEQWYSNLICSRTSTCNLS